MTWSDDIADLHADVFGSFGEPVTWADQSTSRAIIDQRQEPRLYETTVSEPIWTIEFLRADHTGARNDAFTRADGSAWKLGERIEGGNETSDVWSIRRA
ncbi:MAG: hypothetical protein EOM22_08970 [Gammaproteobacteria bacterium]|nr:hypothetical protein [Gammaproteobacteria bacterium]